MATARGCITCGSPAENAIRSGEFALCTDCGDGLSRREIRETFQNHRDAIVEAVLGDDPGFEDYLRPIGEYDLPAYTFLPDDHPVIERIVERRADWIAANYDLREKHARTIAYSEAGGWTHAGLAKKLDVAESTAKSYMDDVREELGDGAFTSDPFSEIDRELDVGVGSDRQCPVCLMDRVCGVGGAKAAFRTKSWGKPGMLDRADLVCSFCHAVRIDGDWQRMEPVAQRAWNLAEGSGSNDVDHYRDVLTSGMSV